MALLNVDVVLAEAPSVSARVSRAIENCPGAVMEICQFAVGSGQCELRRFLILLTRSSLAVAMRRPFNHSRQRSHSPISG